MYAHAKASMRPRQSSLGISADALSKSPLGQGWICFNEAEAIKPRNHRPRHCTNRLVITLQ